MLPNWSLPVIIQPPPCYYYFLVQVVVLFPIQIAFAVVTWEKCSSSMLIMLLVSQWARRKVPELHCLGDVNRKK